MQRIVSLAAGAALATAATAARGQEFTVVAEPGYDAPGFAAGTTYTALPAPSLSDQGAMLFGVELTGGGVVPGTHALFLGPPGGLVALARTGEAAPGTGAVYGAGPFRTPLVRLGGRVAFGGTVDGADTAHDEAVWAGTASTLQLLVREGDFDLATGAVFASPQGTGIASPAMNAAGSTAFRVRLAGVGVLLTDDQAIYAGTPGALALVAREGQPAAGAFGPVWASFPAATAGGDAFSAPSINGPGTLLFRGSLAGAGVTTANRQGLWIGTAGALNLAARGGDQAPGLPAGQSFLDFTEHVLADSGTLLVAARTSNAVGTGIVGGVWSGVPGGLVAVAVETAAVAGDPVGAAYGTTSMIRLNAAGQIAFKSSVFSASENRTIERVHAGTPNHVRTVARAATAAPGADGVTYASLPHELYLNGSGRLVYRATLTDGSSALFTAETATGVATLLVRTGSAITVDDLPRVPTSLALYAGANAGDPGEGRASALSEAGDVTFLATFADGGTAIVRTGTGGGPPPCTELSLCLARLRSVLPDPASSTTKAAKRVAASLASLLGKADKALAKADAATGAKRAKKLAALRAAVTKLLDSAERADAKGSLAVPLRPLTRFGGETIALLP